MSNASNSTRNFIAMQNRYDRVVLLVDMDCFYCQVEEKLDPTLKGQPLAVVQYNAWRGGGIIAVNYAARAKGVTRHMRGDEAKEQCPDIRLVKVPNVREKADLSKYRDAGKEVANVLQRFTALLERASVDEAYLDITDTVNKRLVDMNEGKFVLQPQELFNTYAVGHNHIGEYINEITQRISKPPEGDIVIDDFQYAHDASDAAVRQSDLRLLIGASIANEIRTAVKTDTGYECSAGIAHNKILAKLACGINKPNKQTILPLVQIPRLFETLPVGKIKGLGAKFGEEVCERLRVRFLGQLLKFTEHELQRKFDEKNGTWLYYMCRGIDLEAVTPRFYSKSIGCCKKFPGRNNITGLNTLKHWLGELAKEINDRLEKDAVENSRKAKQLVVNYVQDIDGDEVSSSRSTALASYQTDGMAMQALDVIKANTKTFLRQGSEAVLNNPIKFLGISVGKFEPLASGQNKLHEMFANQAAKQSEAQKKRTETAATGDEAETSVSKVATRKTPDLSKETSFNHNTLKEKGDKPSEQPAQFRDVESPVETKDDQSVKSLFERLLLKRQEQANAAQPSQTHNKEKETPTRTEQPLDVQAEQEVVQLERQLREFDSAELPQTELPTVSGLKKRKFDEVDTPADYKARFVEFAVPELRPELLRYTACETCGLQIPMDERSQQTHQDEHFAQQLSKQQRMQYRDEIKAKTAKKSPPPAKGEKKRPHNASAKGSAKARTSSSPKQASRGIAKFFKQSDSAVMAAVEPSTSAAVQKCEKCNLSIPFDELAEHMDYHLAKELQRQLNQLEVHTVDISKSSKHNTTQAKRNSLNATLNTSSERGGNMSKNITHFFSQANMRS